MPRYCEVTENPHVFKSGWERLIVGTDLQQIWLDHLLVLATLQHPSGEWTWGRFCMVYPSANPSVRDAVERYADALADLATFEVRTIEELLDAHVLHTPQTETRFRER